MLPGTLSTWENWISENLCDLWVCTKNLRLKANVVFSIPYCLLSYFLSAYGTVLGAIETLPRTFQFRNNTVDTPAWKGHHIQPNWHWSATLQLFISCNALTISPSLSPSLLLSCVQPVADSGCCFSAVMPRAVFAAVEAIFQQLTPWCRPGCLSPQGLHLPTLSLKHARLPWQPSPLHLPCWPCHTHPWENLQMYPEQNTEAWARRRMGSRAAENTGQVPNRKEKRNDRL